MHPNVKVTTGVGHAMHRDAPHSRQCSARAIKPRTQWTTASPYPIQGGEGAELDGAVPPRHEHEWNWEGDEGRVKAGVAGA